MTTVLQPPALDHDAMMLERFKSKVIPRGKIERRVVWNLLSQLNDAGFTAWAVDDGDERTACESIKDVMELVFNLDEAHIYCEGKSGKRNWMYIVLGNDGYDAISDYGYHPDPKDDVDGWDAILNGFDGEEFV